ncbi:hypothetical protein IU459_23105 [Nocardia amamiensis]|uniref:Uncharacterized protein n=1 Tax=Nocardia amamiensis TaxID=404578 RepID=A0ABS0CUY5_9NOCA|nr:hypothetical protein [Nocardia amamiensis]MBF6300411.1 hypothetical protein [Nocardia amamiensis]
MATTRLTVPTMAVGAHPVGDAPTLARQLAPTTDDLVHPVMPGCGHIIPCDET